MRSLACVIPIFNFAEDPILESNLIAGIQKLQRDPCDIYVSRAVLPGATIPQEPPGVAGQFVACTDSLIWQKEALINRGVRLLFGHYDAVAWIDNGIYLTPGWAARTVQALQRYDVVQCFDSGYWLSKTGRPEASCGQKKRLGYICALNKGLDPQTARPKFSTGMAWAARKEIIEQFPLYDRAIVGGGDTWALQGFTGLSTPEAQVCKCLTEDHRKHIREWLRARRPWQFSVGYVLGEYSHLWHTTVEQRQHNTRHKLLKKYGFRPKKDTALSGRGLVEWTHSASRGLRKAVERFVLFRSLQNA